MIVLSLSLVLGPVHKFTNKEAAHLRDLYTIQLMDGLKDILTDKKKPSTNR